MVNGEKDARPLFEQTQGVIGVAKKSYCHLIKLLHFKETIRPITL